MMNTIIRNTTTTTTTTTDRNVNNKYVYVYVYVLTGAMCHVIFNTHIILLTKSTSFLSHSKSIIIKRLT